MICSLNNNQDLKVALEEYVNGLIGENSKGPKFDPAVITQTIFNELSTEFNDTNKALGIVYHVPQLIFSIIDSNPEYDLKSFMKKGYNPTAFLNDVITPLENAEDKLKAIGGIVGVEDLSVEDTEIILADQETSSGIIDIKASAASKARQDKYLAAALVNTTTQETSKEVWDDTLKKYVPIKNETDKDKVFYQNVLQKLLGATRDNDLDFSTVEYSGEKGFRLKGMLEKEIYEKSNGKIRANREKWLEKKVAMVAITDNNGELYYFNTDGSIDKTKTTGKPVYFNLRSAEGKSYANLRSSAESVASRSGEAFIEDDFNKAIAELESLSHSIKAGYEVMLDIIGGLKGTHTDPGTLSSSEQKEVQAPLSEFNLTPTEIKSVGEPVQEQIHGVTVTLPGIRFENSDSTVSLKNTQTIGEQDPALLEHLVDILTEEITTLTGVMTPADKFEYVSQFISPARHLREEVVIDGKVTEKGIKAYNIAVTNMGTKQALVINFGGANVNLANKEAAKKIIKDFLGAEVTIHFHQASKDKGTYKYLNLSKTDTGFEGLDEPLDYIAFILPKMTPRIIKDKTTGRPMIINGYFTYSPVMKLGEVRKAVEATTAKVKEAEIPLTKDDNDIILKGLSRSKLIASTATPEQKLAAEKWWKETQLSKAVDEDGKPIISLNLLLNTVNSDAWAQFSNATMTLYEGGDYTHLYHEAWHAFSQIYLTLNERTKLYEGVNKLKGTFQVVKKITGPDGTTYELGTIPFSTATRQEAEEFIAEEFRTYAMNGGKFKVKSEKTTLLGKIFARIWKALKALVGGASDVNVYSNPGAQGFLTEIFNTLYIAKTPADLLAFTPSINNSEFGTLNSGILAQNGDTILTLSESLLLSRTIDGIISNITTSYVKKGKYGAVIEILRNTKLRAELYKRALSDLNTQREAFLPQSNALALEINELERKRKIASEADKLKLAEEILQATTRKVILDNKIALLTKATTPEVYGSIEQVIDGKDTVNSVLAFHNQNSSFKEMFSTLKKEELIEKDPVEWDETAADEEGLLGKINDVPSNGIASEELANSLILYLVKSLTKQDRVTGKPELNELGFAEPIEFKPFWRVLMDKASGETSVMGLYNKLETAGRTVHPLFTQLLSKISKIEGATNNQTTAFNQIADMFTGSTAIADIWMKLVQTLNLHRIDLVSTLIQVDNKTHEVTLKVGKSTAEHQYIVNRDWPSRFQQQPVSDFVKKEDGVNYINLKNVAKKFIVEGTNTKGGTTYSVAKKDYIPFLNSIGLYLTNNAEIRASLEAEDLIYIVNAIGQKAKSMAENVSLKTDGISNISEFLSQEHEVLIDNVAVEIDNNSKALNEIGALEANFSDAYSSSMRYTPTGDLKSTHALNSSDTQKIKALNRATRKGDLYMKYITGTENNNPDIPLFMHMNYLNPLNNPSAKGLITMNSLFSEVTGERNGDNKVELYDLAGTQYISEDFVSKGVQYSKMNLTDKVLSSFLATLASGYMETTTPGDKSSYLCMKLNKIHTYMGKDTSYLYVDTHAFLKNKEGDYLMGYNPMQKVLEMLYPKLEGEIKRIAMIKADPEYYNKIAGFENADKFDIFDEILDSKTKGNKLKTKLSSAAFFKKLNTAGNLKNLLFQDKALKAEIDAEILEFFDNLIDVRYEKNLFQPLFGNTQVLPQVLQDVILKDVSDRSKLGEVDYVNAAGDEKSSIDANIKQAALRSYAINNFIHKTETVGILQGDGFQFNHEKDAFTKRTPGSQSGGRVFPTDALTQIFINSRVKRPLEEALLKKSLFEGGIVRKKGLPEGIRPYRGLFNTAVISESNIVSEYTQMYDDLFRRDLKEKGYTDEDEISKYLYGEDGGTIGTKNNIFKGGKLKPFTDINDGDGQGWVTFDSYRILKRLEGQWSDPQEEAFQKIVKGETLSAFELSEMFPVYKLQHYGALDTATGRYPVQSFHKFSLFPLIPSVIKDFPAEQMHLAMMAQNIDYATFPTGSKKSYIKANAETDGDVIYNEDTSNIKPFSQIDFTPNTVYVANLKNQTDVNSRFKNNATFSTQLRKLITGGLYQYGVPVDYIKNNKKKFKSPEDAVAAWDKLTETQKNIASEFHRLSEAFTASLAKLVAYKKAELLEELEFVEDKNGDVEGNTARMITFLVKELKKQGFSDHEISILSTDKPNEVDLSISPLAARFEKLIMSVVNNRLVRIKLNGEAFVQLSSVFMQKFRKPTKTELRENGAFGSNGLRSYVTDPEKNTLGFMFKRALNKMDQRLFQTNYFIKNDKGEYVDSGKKIGIYETVKDENGKETKELNFEESFARLNEMLRNDAWRTNDENYKKLRLTGVRIPVQGDNSMEFGEVAEFLRPEAGPVIIIPAEIVAKSGGDFDVDKLTTYLPYITKSGKLLKDVPEHELDARIAKLQPKFDKLKDTPEGIKIFKDKRTAEWANVTGSLNKFRRAVELEANGVKDISDKGLANLTTRKNKDLLNTIDAPGMQVYLRDNFKKAYKIYQKEIKGVTVDELLQIEESLEELYEAQTEFGKVSRELREAKEHRDNYIAGIQNRLLDDMINIMQLSQKAPSLMSPNDTNIAKPIARELESAIQKADNETDFTKSIKSGKKLRKKGISPTNVYTEDYNNKKQQENIAGKGSLGIAAVDNYINILLNMAGTTMNKFMSIETKEEGKIKHRNVDITLMLQHNILNGKISLSHILDANGEHSIAEVISQLMNGFVDVGNDAWVGYLQGNVDVVPKILFMLEAGVPLKEIAYLVSNPITRSYIKDRNKRGSTLSPLIYGIGHKSDAFTAADAARGNILNQIALPPIARENIDNLYGLSQALNHYGNPTHFTKEALEEAAKSTYNIADDAQIAGFLQYLYVEKLIEDYDETKKVLNPDTKTTKDLYSAEAKIRDVEKVSNTASIDPAFTKKMVEDSIIAPFFIQAFARKLFGRLFKLRNDSNVSKFLLDISDKKITQNAANRPQLKSTGYDMETYVIKFKNFIAQYIFANELTQYTGQSKTYKGIPISDAFFKQVNKDFDTGAWKKGNTEANSYEARGLAPINEAAFPVYKVNKRKEADKDVEIGGREAFIEFALEREYLRREDAHSFDSIKNTKEFKLRRTRLINTGSITYAKYAQESEAAYNDRLNPMVYEDYLMNKALTNTYNIWQLFRSGDNTIARELMDIIENYKELSDNPEFAILQQFAPDSITNDPKFRGVVNFTLKNYSNLDEGLVGDYNTQWNKLIDKKFTLVGDTEDTSKAATYISNFFTSLPNYSFLQSGMNPGEFSLASIMPYKNYQKIMEKASDKFINKLNAEDPTKILGGLKRLFELENSLRNPSTNVKTAMLRNRGGVNIKRSLDSIPVTVDSLYEQPFIKEQGDGSGIFIMDRLYFKNGETHEVAHDQVKRLKEANPDVVFITSVRDLVEYSKPQVPGRDQYFTADDIKQAKTDIAVSINIIRAAGKVIVIYPEAFMPNGVPIKATSTVSPVVAALEPFKIGDWVDYGASTYLVLKKNENGTWQIYNPGLEGAAAKISVAAGKIKRAKDESAKTVTWKDKDYLVTPKGSIVSLTTGTLMKWGAENGDRKGIIALANASEVVTTATQAQPTGKILEGDIFALPGIPVITTNLGGVHGAGLAQAAKAKGLITQGNGDFKATDKVVQLPVKKKWSDSMDMNNNMELLKESLRSLIKTAKANAGNTYLLPLAGLGHGEGSIEDILPLLIKTIQASPNIKLVLPAEGVNLGRQGTVRKDHTRESMPKIKSMLSEAGILSTQVQSAVVPGSYSAIFFDTNALTTKYKPVHPNVYSHHSTIEFQPADMTGLPVGKKGTVKIVGRLTTDKVDVLLVENSLSKNKYPHITLSTAEGIKPFESNKEIENNQDKIVKLNDTIKGTLGYFAPTQKQSAAKTVIQPGLELYKGALTKEEQKEFYEFGKSVLEKHGYNPFPQYVMASAGQMEWSPEMVADKKGNTLTRPGDYNKKIIAIKKKLGGKDSDDTRWNYHYYLSNFDGSPITPIPANIIKTLEKITGQDMSDYDTVLINLYPIGRTLGWHQDTTEDHRNADRDIISVSIGANADFTYINRDKLAYTPKGDFTASGKENLKSGDVITFGDKSRLIQHTVSNVTGTTDLGPIDLSDSNVNQFFKGGLELDNWRMNFTFRVADPENNKGKRASSTQPINKKDVDNLPPKTC